ncbi:phosphatidylinositol-binding protein scs2, partial [Nowakowskiella sp. JEL0078]
MSEIEGHFLVLNPDKELEFTRPLTSVVKKNLVVSNIHPTSSIAFKVKTTAPKQYCVRPNSGRIRPGENVEVLVLLQAMREDPPPDFKCKDKFLVQSMKIPESVFALEGDEATNKLAELWSSAETMKKNHPDMAVDLITEKKLRVSFLPASGIIGDLPIPEKPSSFEPALSVHSLDKSVSSYNTSAVSTQSAISNKRDTIYATPSAIQNLHFSSPSITNPYEQELLEAKDSVRRFQLQVEGYKSEIERLNTLRHRKTNTSASVPTEFAISSQSPNQVISAGQTLPLHIVALLLVIAFLLGA